LDNYFLSFLQINNFRARVIPISRLTDLKEDFMQTIESGHGYKNILDTYLKDFSFQKPKDIVNPRSIIILAAPRPQHLIIIHTGTGTLRGIIPPTYTSYRETASDVQEKLGRFLADRGYCISKAVLPLKLLAARSGLGKYGKNNILYIDDWGSFHQLIGFYSDMEVQSDSWQEAGRLNTCQDCKLCMENCPTGAIRQEEFIIDTGLCLTYYNENSSRIPSWVSGNAHNCLIGCMKCQVVCPCNKRIAGWFEDLGELDREECSLLLEAAGGSRLPENLIKKFKGFGLHEYLDVIPRNLKLLVENNPGSIN
jgi:epoxyqueuosine reductase